MTDGIGRGSGVGNGADAERCFVLADEYGLALACHPPYRPDACSPESASATVE